MWGVSDAVCLYLIIGGVAIFVATILVLRSRAIQENVRLRHFIAPILQHADSHDYAPPLKFSVAACREIKEKVNGI